MCLARWLGWSAAAMGGFAAALPLQSVLKESHVEAANTYTIYEGLSQATCCGWVLEWEHFGWHDDEQGEYSALDLSYIGFDDTTGVDTFLSGDGTPVRVVVTDHPGNCTGADTEFYDVNTGAYLSEEHYVHIIVAKGVVGSAFDSGSSTMYFLGDVAGSQNNCPWDAAHLHQSGNNALDTALHTNWSVPNPISIWDWMHELRW